MMAAAIAAGCSRRQRAVDRRGGSGGGAAGTTGSGGGCVATGGAPAQAATGGSAYTRVAVCGQRGPATATATTYSGWEEFFMTGDEGLGDDVCVVRFDVKRSGAAPGGCTECSWTQTVEYSNPTIVKDVSGACANSDLGLTAAKIASVTGTQMSIGFVREWQGRARQRPLPLLREPLRVGRLRHCDLGRPGHPGVHLRPSRRLLQLLAVMRRLSFASALSLCVACAPGGGDGGGAGAGGGAAGAGSGAAGTTGAAGSAAGAAGNASGAAGSGIAGNGGATTGTAGAGAGDSFVTGVTVTVHAQTTTILVVTWTQAMAADTTWLEFSFAGSSLMTSRAQPGATGAHRDVVLGVPASTAVTVRIVSRQGGVDYKTRDYMGTTGALPTGMPLPTLLSYNAALASPDRYMFGSVEDSTGGCTDGNCYYDGRSGSTSWTARRASSGTTPTPPATPRPSFQRIARDGEYIWIEKSRTRHARGPEDDAGSPVHRRRSPSPGWPTPSTSPTTAACSTTRTTSCASMNKRGTAAGGRSGAAGPRSAPRFNCYSNTVNWNAADDTVLMSFPEPNTVAQINRQTGALVATYGDRAGSYTFSPTTWSFEFQHFPNITAGGDADRVVAPADVPAQTARPGRCITRSSSSTSTARTSGWSRSGATRRARSGPGRRGWRSACPTATRWRNYGTGGAIREITPDKQTAFHVKFDVPTGDDYFNKMVGHNVLINDLYALNGGGPR